MTKIGRNAPCFCGSGKKYKKCCLDKENQSTGEAIFLQDLGTLWNIRFTKEATFDYIEMMNQTKNILN